MNAKGTLMSPRFSSLLARSGQGEAHYCACRDRISLRFKGRGFCFGPDRLPEFRRALGRLLDDGELIRRLIGEARAEASARGLPAADLPTVEDFREMLGLIDAAILVREAQEIIRQA
jgi:hypothetical protein